MPKAASDLALIATLAKGVFDDGPGAAEAQGNADLRKEQYADVRVEKQDPGKWQARHNERSECGAPA